MVCAAHPLRRRCSCPGHGAAWGPWAAWGARTPTSAPLRVPRDTSPATLDRENKVSAVPGAYQNQARGFSEAVAEAGRLGSYCFLLGGVGELFISQ